jgi:hypothetical protein
MPAVSLTGQPDCEPARLPCEVQNQRHSCTRHRYREQSPVSALRKEFCLGLAQIDCATGSVRSVGNLFSFPVDAAYDSEHDVRSWIQPVRHASEEALSHATLFHRLQSSGAVQRRGGARPRRFTRRQFALEQPAAATGGTSPRRRRPDPKASWCRGKAWPGTRRARLAPPKVSPPEQAEDKDHGPYEQRYQQDRRSALGRAQVGCREAG